MMVVQGEQREAINNEATAGWDERQ